MHLVLDESTDRLSVETETELLRIAQEAITNARRHSRARNLWVTCRVNPQAPTCAWPTMAAVLARRASTATAWTLCENEQGD